MDAIITEPLLRGLIRIAPGETRCNAKFHLSPTTEWLNVNLLFANPTTTWLFYTDTINFTGFHPALITLNHSVVYRNINMKGFLSNSTLNSHNL